MNDASRLSSSLVAVSSDVEYDDGDVGVLRTHLRRC